MYKIAQYQKQIKLSLALNSNESSPITYAELFLSLSGIKLFMLQIIKPSGSANSKSCTAEGLKA